MLLLSIISASLLLATTTAIEVGTVPSNHYLFKNNLTATFVLTSDAQILPALDPNILKNNGGDLIWTSDRRTNDTLQFSEIFINEKNTADRVWEIKVKKTPLIITEIRFMNIGRQIAVNPDPKIVRSDGESTVELKFSVRKNEQVRVWVEIYGRNSSAFVTSSWLLISLSTLFYYFYNKY